jgi:hypothetical protein
VSGIRRLTAHDTTALDGQVPAKFISGDTPYISDPDKTRWAMSSDNYVKAAIIDVEKELEKVGNHLPTKVSTPLTAGYRAEIDQSPELDARRLTYYQGLVGVLRWICELGIIAILVDTTNMSSYLAPSAGVIYNKSFTFLLTSKPTSIPLWYSMRLSLHTTLNSLSNKIGLSFIPVPHIQSHLMLRKNTVCLLPQLVLLMWITLDVELHGGHTRVF